MKKYLMGLPLLLIACQSRPWGHVRVGDAAPMGNCTEIGQVIGHANSRYDSKEKAIDDLRHEAAVKSGNYVRLLAVSAHGLSVRGLAYRCQ